MPSIKAASPKLLHISYVGVYVVGAGALLHTLNSAALINVELRHYICQFVWSWAFPIGFTLSFGPVAMRTYRIYRIFEHYLNPGKFISDPFLITGALLLLPVNLIVAVIWTIADHFTTKQVIYRDNGSQDQVSQLHIRLDCTCEYLNVWIGNVYLYFFWQ